MVERNLDNDLSHSSPEIAICGELSTVHCQIDVEQYKLVRAMLDQNLGEELNDLQRVAKQLPQIQTILGGEVGSHHKRTRNIMSMVFIQTLASLQVMAASISCDLILISNLISVFLVSMHNKKENTTLNL